MDEDHIIADDEDRGTILAVFVNETKLSINTLRDIISLCEDRDIKHLILVFKESITSSARNTLDKIYTINVEQFSLNELQYNPTTHRLCSKHEKAADDEAADIKKKYGPNLPILLRTDKQVRWYNYKHGDIIRVTRPTGHVIYRIVK